MYYKTRRKSMAARQKQTGAPIRFKRDDLRIPLIRNAHQVILSHQRRHQNVEEIMLFEMEKRLRSSLHNRIKHYKISIDRFSGGTKKQKNMFRSLANPQDLQLLKGKDFFNKETLNPYQRNIKRKIQHKHGKYFYLRDLYNQYDMDIHRQSRQEQFNKKKKELQLEEDLMQVR